MSERLRDAQLPERRRARQKPTATGRDGKRTRKGNPATGPKACGVENWGWLPAEMLRCPAYHAMSGNAVKVTFRVLSEHISEGGTMNGELVISHEQFIAAGISRNCVAGAIREAEAAGMIAVRRRGRIAEGRNAPNLFRLTWLGGWGPNGEKIHPSHDWKGRTAEDVKRAREREKAAKEKRAKAKARAVAAAA